MKTWQIYAVTAAFWLAVPGGATSLAADTAVTVVTAPSATAATQPKRQGAVTDPAVNLPKVDDYYLTKGTTYAKLTARIEQLPATLTGLDQGSGKHYYRVDKELRDKYFYRVCTYDEATRERLGEYLTAKDGTNVWRVRSEGDTQLIYGSAATLLQKVRIQAVPGKIPLGTQGALAVAVPGNVPCAVALHSLNDAVAAVSSDGVITPVACGKTAIAAQITVGNLVKNDVVDIFVVPKDYYTRLRQSQAYYLPVLFGWGFGWDDDWRWRHSHRHRMRPPPRRVSPPPHHRAPHRR